MFSACMRKLLVNFNAMFQNKLNGTLPRPLSLDGFFSLPKCGCSTRLQLG